MELHIYFELLKHITIK